MKDSKARYIHKSIRPEAQFQEFRYAPANHMDPDDLRAALKKAKLRTLPKGARILAGKFKPSVTRGRPRGKKVKYLAWGIKSILIPKKGRRANPKPPPKTMGAPARGHARSKPVPKRTGQKRRPALRRSNPYRLSAGDKRAIKAFTERRPEDGGNLLTTNGTKLEKMGIGSETVAVWRSDKIVITSSESVKSDETILHALRKEAPKNWFAKRPNAGRRPKTRRTNHTICRHTLPLARGSKEKLTVCYPQGIFASLQAAVVNIQKDLRAKFTQLRRAPKITRAEWKFSDAAKTKGRWYFTAKKAA